VAVPNAVIASLGAAGQVCFYTQNTSYTHAIADLQGYFAPLLVSWKPEAL
jgi:hypothetical protein